MKYNFDQINKRGDAHEAKYLPFPKGDTEYEYSLTFSAADMEFQCSAPIKEALQKVVDKNLYGYTLLLPFNANDFYEAVISWYKRRYGIEIGIKNIYYTEGALAGARAALKAFTKPGDGVIINKPSYGPFESSVIRPMERKVVESKLVTTGDGYYTLDFEDLEEKAADPNTTAYLLCSPQNPVGRVWTEDELLKIYDICQRNNVLIISDEVHCDFVRKGSEFVSISKITGGKGIVTCAGLGKSFNLAQLRPGIAVVTDEELIAPFAKAVGWSTPSEFTIQAIKAAYNESEDWLDQVNEYLDENIETALEFFRTRMPKVKCRRPEGTYLLWIDFSGYGLSDEEIHKRIYEKAWIKLEDGTEFDPELGKGYQRMCVTAPRSVLLEALERIAKQFEE